MSCVNRNSKEFKFLAEHNNLSVNALELLTHKYWLENQTEDYFPSDVYIQAQLGKIPYEEPTKAVRELWGMKYKDPKEYQSLEELQEARKEALRFFPEEAVTYHTNFKGNYVLTIRKPMARLSLSMRDLTGRRSHDEQEQADFNLVVKALSKEQGKNITVDNAKKNLSSNPLKSATDNNGEFSNEDDDIQMSISSPQTFTFKDGTTVKAPFKPNYQQVDALNAMDEFIKSNRTSMTLSGYAGTGKTSLMEMLAEKMNKQYRPIMFCASTNKAAAVLKERVSKAGFDASTLNKIFGITVEVDPNKSYNARNLVNKLKDPKIPAGTTVVIDEASMINEENYEILNSIAEKNHLKIIYVGDAAQLAPVNETKISKVFRDQNHEVRTLSIVERTGDNAILKEATSLREGEALSGESSFNSKGQGVAYLKANNTQEKEAIIKRFIPELKSNPNYFRILAYTNAAVSNYNAQVRSLLGYNDNIPRVGEPITGYANWGYIWDRNGGKYRFINSEAYKVIKVGSPKNAHISLPDGSIVTMQAIPITLENSLGEKDTFNLMDIKGNQENRRIATQLANVKSQLWNQARGLSGRAKAPILQQINAIDEFLFVNDNITDGERTLQAKIFDFGYAMTVHKSQGSTFTHVLMDDVDIDRARDEKNTGIGMEDVAIDWEDAANEEPVNYEVAGPMEDVDMGDWEDEAPSTEGTLIQEAPKAENPDAANIRQQLKYVAVSRATDTVTIISDNVKKEDTPLNHINEAPVSKAPVSENKPVEQMSSKEVWRYLSALQPTTKRVQVEYTPKGQARQTYTVENGHIYNSKGTEVYPGKTVHKNMVLANYAVQEGLAVVVKHPTTEEKYVVDNNGQIISVRTGDIMKWGEGNGDRRRILAQAEKEFRERIAATKERGNTFNEQLLDHLQLTGLDLHYEDEMAQYLRKHKNVQEVIEENYEMQSIKEKALANGTFMKAPNGKDTNLTERQWLQVRTNNFRKWFGDWLNYQKIRNATVIWGHPGTGKTWLHQQGRQDIIDFDSDYKSRLGSLKEREQLKKRIGKQAYNQELDKLFDEARQKAISAGKKLLVSDIHFLRDRVNDLDAITNISDKEFIERSHQRGEHNEADKMEWKNSINEAMQNAPEDKVINTTGYISDLIDGTNVSKVVDENGEPLVVYRTNSRKFNGVFDAGDIYFSSDKEYTEPYNRGSSDANSVAVFLNIKTPLDHRLEDYSNYGKNAVLVATGEQVKAEDYQIENRNVRKWREQGLLDGKDGIIGNDSTNYWAESNNEKAVSDGIEYVVFKSNQVKSATDNNGMFSTENPDIQMFIGKKARTKFEQQLMKARPDLATPHYDVEGTDFIKDPFSNEYISSRLDAVTVKKLQEQGIIKEGTFAKWALTEKGKEKSQITHPEIDAVLDFLHSLEDNKENTVYIKTAIRWIANRSLTLPQDHTKAYQAFELARKKHLDLQKYNTLGELITAPEMQPKRRGKKDFDPDKATTFTNKRTVTTKGGRIFTVYDVENTEEGQREVCKALAAHYEMSPWCLSTFTATGEPTQSAKNYWNQYDGIPRKIAYENGKPVAFSSDYSSTPKRFDYNAINGHELPVGLWAPNRLNQNQSDGIGRREFNQDTFNYLIENGYIERNTGFDWVINDDAYKLTQKGEQAVERIHIESELEDREAWWDMEDTHPQDSLSDSIVSDLNSKEALRNTAEIAAEGLGLLGRPDEIDTLVEMQQQHVPLTETNYRNFRQQQEDNYRNNREANERELLLTYEREGFPEPVNPNQEAIDNTLPFLQTAEGEIRGFATPEGSLYLDRTAISPEHPIHEYTHLWDRVVAKNNPELWHRGVALMKQISLWKDIENDENYGKKWKALKGMNPQKLESLIASEVHSRLTGVNGEQILDRLSKEKGQKGIIGRLKQWLLDFWKDLKATFSNWSQEDLDKLTLQDFTMMTIRDLADGFNPNTFQQISTKQFVNHSGGAVGSDMYWGKIGERYGVSSNHYYYSEKTPYGNKEISQQDFEEGRQESAKAAAYNYDYKYATMKDPRLIRNWAQVKYADAIFAIGHLAKPGERLFPNISGDTRVAKNAAVTGGTGYAVAMAILHNKPVYVFDQERGKWYKHVNGKWSESDVPTLTPNFAGIGTRKITEAGIQAIEDVYAKTFNVSQQPAQQQPALQQSTQFEYARNANGKPNYEVSSRGDKRFSAMTATFAPGTTLFGHDVSGRTIESVYQHGVKQGDWATNNNSKTGAPKDKTIITGNTENDSYTQGYLPLWQEWARQNPQLIEELRQKAQGKILTDMFASTAVSQARALADILNQTQQPSVPASYEGMITPDVNTIFVFGSNPEGRHGAGAAKTAKEKFGAIYGQGEGLQGNSYALPTKDLRVKENKSLRSISPTQITENIQKMYEVARQNPSKQFKVAYTNGLNETTLNGYTGAEMIKMFKDAGPIPSNVVFSKNWTDHWNEVQSEKQSAEEPLDTSAIFQNPSSTEVTVEDKMKPWRSDPSKQNISRRIYLKGHKDKGYFEVVKDFEDGYYSVHFKPTDSDNPNAFSKEEKETLFQAVADTIPVDGKLSTWGELSRGGIAGLERFSKLGFAQSGERTVTMKGTGEEVTIPVFTKYPETTQKISLPNYEDFIGATDETLVDAAWKVPYLQRLDAQLAEENPDIIKQMQSLLEATSEKEWVNQSDSKAKEQVAKTLDEYDKLIAQLNNLLDSNLISASEVRHTAELVVNAISDNITQLQKEKGLAEQQFPTLKSKLDFQTASRKDIIKAVGIDRLVYRAKLLFDPEVNEYEDLDTIEQADLIIENWDAIMTLASDIFAMNEGIGISRDFDNGGWQSTEGQKIDFDNFNDYENDPDAMAEETKDEQEHWQIEQRTIDILNSMSAMVRLALHECYQIDKEGNVIKSKWGIPERVNSRKAVNSILRWTQGALSLEDMIVKLSAKQAQQPWLGQLLERLSDKSGRETDFQSQFYGVFAKHFQLYSIVLEEGAKPEDRKYKVMHVNSHPALTEAMQTITTQFKVGEHPLFTSKGINKTLLGNNDTTGSKATFNLHKALAELLVINDSLQHGEDLTAETAEKATKNVVAVCKTLGYPVTEELVAEIINNDSIADFTKYLGFMVNSLDKAAKAGKADYDPFAYNKENSIGGTLRNFLTPITDLLEDSATNAFYDSGKMYQSYVTPSFMTKLLQKFNLEGEAFEDFLDSEYGNSEWFKFRGRNGIWRNEWLRLLATNEEARKIFDHKVELNFNKHNYMRNMTDAEYTLSLFAEYFAEHAEDKQEMVPAWFRIPMQSNKPSSEFIKFYSYRGANYKENIIHGLHSIFLQELSRIQTVRMRNRAKNDPDFIKNFDKNGRQFNFLPFLNSYLENTAAAKKERTLLDTTEENNELATLLQDRIEGVRELSSEEEARLDTLVDKALYNHTDRRAQNILARWDHEGIVEAAKRIEGMSKDTEEVRNALENFLWNDTFAAKNILQLTVGDIAFYKDAEDLQKRLAQLHAPGTRGNVAATDYEGNRVSDGYYRTFILQDFDTFKSNIIANIAEVFDRKIAAAPENQKAQLRALKESLVGENGKYTKINVTDAQGYSSPSSYRKKAFIFGKWSHKAEDIYQKLLNGDYNYTDLETAFQPLKPFVYTHLEKHIGEGTPIETMKVPFQAKNSEYLLIMADALMQSEVRKSGELSRPNLLRAVYRVMEDSARIDPTRGIDTVQFESAIKSGLQGKINIHQFAEDAGGENAAYDFMMGQIYQNYDPLKSLEEQQLQYNTDTFVHEAPFEDYCLQQEVPEHFKGHQQAHGSQIRMITPSDLDYYKMDSEGKEVVNYYEWTEPDGKKKRITADEFKKEYERTIAANIEESINNLTNELHLNSLDKKERNIALSKILLREILSSPRYGIDLAQACAVDKATGEFRIPKGDPIQAKRIEQLINSIIKNRVNKQKIAGGPIVQVTNFGTSKQLHIRFKDNSGKILLTEEEFNNKLKGEAVRIIYKDYKEYLQKEQHGIAYFEVFIPIWANEIFEKFANEDGTIDVKAIEAVDPDLLKMISYRIPTEDKYSCAPMKVVGFMPREAGDAIMLPYELTEIDDSDFDVDKRYVMRKDIKIKENKDAIEKLLIQRVSESFAKAHNGKVNRKFIVDQVKMYMDNPNKMKSVDKLMEAIHREKQIIMKLHKDKVYKSIKPKSGKTYRDNRIVDMTWAVLTNEMTADKILNPGGFDNFKKVGYAAAAYKLKEGSISWNELQNMSIDELNDLCYVDKDLTWADTQIQFYKQNAAAASLIGVFAVNKVAHATLEGDDLYLDIAEAIGSEQPFTIGSTVFGGRRNAEGKPLMTEKEYDEWIKTLPGFKKKDMSYDEYLALNEDLSMRNRMQVDPKYDNEGNLIGKTLGSGVSASADAAKTPVLNLLNINMTTVGTFTSLLRMGMPHEEACLFIGQDVIARVLDEFNRQNLTGYASLDSIITAHINHIKDVHGISNDADINSEPLTKEELVEGLTTKEHEVIDYKVLIAFQKAKALAGSIRKASFATRFNSISSAVGPLIIDNLIMEHKMEQFMDENEGTNFYTRDNVPVDITDIFADHPVLRQFAKTVDIAKQMTSDMPAGSTGFRNLLKTLPEDVKEKIYNDKKLFSKLSDFYQSYLAIASGLINPANLKSYIDGFPKWFMKQEFKEKYPDNALIQNIEMSVSKKTGRAFLNIKLTGEDETLKETYRNAWIDLHKTNPELSQQLFEYCFFRAGIGFSPKTFMAVVPTYVKERLQRKLQNGETATYLDTYRRFPSIPNEVMLDQFIANNWEDRKLVPKKGGKESHFTIKGTELYATTQKDMADLAGLSYIKTAGKGEAYLWKLVSADESGAHYTMLQPLGNNGEYLEMSLNRIESPMSKTTQAEENNDASEIKTTSPSEIDATEQESKPLTAEDLKAKAIAALARDFMDYNEGTFGRKVSQNKANAQAEGMVEHPERYGSLMQAILKFKGIDMSKDEAIKKLKDLDLC